MANIHNDRYDEIKSLIKKSRILLEQDTQDNVAASVQKRINQDQEYETAVSDRESSNREPGDDIEDNRTSSSSPQDKTQKYRISGGILALHGKNKNNLDITTDEKTAFQETMDEFVDEVSDLVDFNTLNVYPSNGDMIKVDADFLEMLNNLQQFYQKFKSKWGKVLASRKKTKESPE